MLTICCFVSFWTTSCIKEPRKWTSDGKPRAGRNDALLYHFKISCLWEWRGGKLTSFLKHRTPVPLKGIEGQGDGEGFFRSHFRDIKVYRVGRKCTAISYSEPHPIFVRDCFVPPRSVILSFIADDLKRQLLARWRKESEECY